MQKVGDEVELRCGKCKEQRDHTVAALSPDGEIERVVCGYCGSSRKYRKPRAKSTTGRGGPRIRKAMAELLADLEEKEARPYLPTDTFDKGQVLEHQKFGRCRVEEVRGDRIDVKFGDGSTRILIHGR